jgi:hypothetical protein
MKALELAQDRLARAALWLGQEREPPLDLREAAVAVERALSASYDAYDHRDERLGALRRAATEALAAEGALESSTPLLTAAMRALEQARAHFAEADRLLASRPPERRPGPAAELHASGSVPRLHELDRPSLAPRIRITEMRPVVEEPTHELLPKPKTFEELAARVAELQARAAKQLEQRPSAVKDDKQRAQVEAPPPGFGPDIPKAISELELIRDRTRELLEEVAMVGIQRAPLLGDPWRSAAILDQRMLRAIDAVVSMGPRALGLVEELALDAPLKDGAHLFGVAMILGSVRGRDALAAAERVFLDYESVDPSARDGLGAALKLSPHEIVPLALRTLLADSDARHRALAIDVLGYRGLASEAELSAAAAGEPLVAAAALPHLAVVRTPALRELVDAALGRDDPALHKAAWIAGAIGNHPRICETLRGALANRDAALLLALTGDGRDASLLLERMRAEPTTALIDAVGWAGDAAAFAPLLTLLEHDDEKLRLSAAYALERLTGAELHADVEIEAEDILLDEPPDPDVGEHVPLRLAVSDPRDRPPPPAKETIVHPTTEPAVWRQWHKVHGESLRPGKRVRRGKPYTPSVSLTELDAALCTPAERRALQRELCIRTGGFVRFDPHDFVPIQEAALEAWAPLAQRGSSQPGSWHRPAPR